MSTDNTASACEANEQSTMDCGPTERGENVYSLSYRGPLRESEEAMQYSSGTM